MLSLPIWKNAPSIRGDVEEALLAALGRRTESSDRVVARLEAFDIEDDGSPEWGYAVDLISSLVLALSGSDAASCLRSCEGAYLDSAFNEIALRLAEIEGRPVSQAEVENVASTDPSWEQANAFVRSLSQ